MEVWVSSMSTPTTGCVFCSIASNVMDANVIYKDKDVTAFRDINPVAPTHILIIPNKHVISVADLEPEDGLVLSKMFLVAKQLAEKEGVSASGYRLITNIGSDGGQTVYHLHLHLIGGRKLSIGLG